jgi:Na+/citrate or Na+/malate symporter
MTKNTGKGSSIQSHLTSFAKIFIVILLLHFIGVAFGLSNELIGSSFAFVMFFYGCLLRYCEWNKFNKFLIAGTTIVAFLLSTYLGYYHYNKDYKLIMLHVSTMVLATYLIWRLIGRRSVK